MATGWPMKTTYANGDVYSASDVNDITGTINLLTSSTLSSSAAKNIVINGGFDIAQRGTSISLAAAATYTYTLDRWQTYTGTNQACTVSRQATADTTNLPSIQYAARYQRNSGQTGTAGLFFTQTIETANSVPFAGKTVVMSFYARRGSNYSATSNILVPYIISGTGTDQNYLTGFTGAVAVATSNVTLTTTWQRFTISGTVATNATQLAAVFNFNPTGTAGTNDYFEVTGVQLELGSTATTFSRAGGTIQGELAACQRYYFRSTGSNSYTYHAQGLAASTTICNINVRPPVTMRITPSGTIEYANLAISDAVATTQAVTAVAWNGTENPNNAVFAFTVASGLTTNRGYWLINNNNANGYIGFSAEL